MNDLLRLSCKLQESGVRIPMWRGGQPQASHVVVTNNFAFIILPSNYNTIVVLEPGCTWLTTSDVTRYLPGISTDKRSPAHPLILSHSCRLSMILIFTILEVTCRVSNPPPLIEDPPRAAEG